MGNDEYSTPAVQGSLWEEPKKPKRKPVPLPVVNPLSKNADWRSRPPSQAERDWLQAWAQAAGFPYYTWPLGGTWHGEPLMGIIQGGEQNWKDFCSDGDRLALEQIIARIKESEADHAL